MACLPRALPPHKLETSMEPDEETKDPDGEVEKQELGITGLERAVERSVLIIALIVGIVWSCSLSPATGGTTLAISASVLLAGRLIAEAIKRNDLS